MSCKHILKRSWKCLGRPLEDVLKAFQEDVSQIRLEDVFKTSWKTKSVTLKTSSRRLEDVLENKKCWEPASRRTFTLTCCFMLGFSRITAAVCNNTAGVNPPYSYHPFFPYCKNNLSSYYNLEFYALLLDKKKKKQQPLCFKNYFREPGSEIFDICQTNEVSFRKYRVVQIFFQQINQLLTLVPQKKKHSYQLSLV